MPIDGTAPTTPSISARLERLPVTRPHWIATGVIGLGLFFDAYGNVLPSTISAVLQGEFDLSGDQLKCLLSSAFMQRRITAASPSRIMRSRRLAPLQVVPTRILHFLLTSHERQSLVKASPTPVHHRHIQWQPSDA